MFAALEPTASGMTRLSPGPTGRDQGERADAAASTGMTLVRWEGLLEALGVLGMEVLPSMWPGWWEITWPLEVGAER